jgi:hypothetical protein
MSWVEQGCYWVWPVIGGVALLLRWFRRTPRKMRKLSKSQRWADQGFCHACGYNLKGVESYMCPECGTVRLYSARRWKSKFASMEGLNDGTAEGQASGLRRA